MSSRTSKSLNPELNKCIENVELMKELIKKKISNVERREGLLSLIEAFDNELVLAPSSTRIEYHGAYPGGLVGSSLKTLSTLSALNKVYESLYGISFPTESMITTALFYDIGKLGSKNEPYYLRKDSEWHNKQGIMYEVNPEMGNMPISLRSLSLLGEFGIKLNFDEFYAISSIKDRVRVSDESVVSGKEPMLAVGLQHAVKLVCLQGSGRHSILD